MNEDAMPPEKVRGVIEAILMTADAPVTPGRLLGFLKELNGRDLRQAIDALKEEYDRAGHAFTIAEVAGGFQLATRKEYGPWVRKFHNRHQVRLTQAGLETLAIVAYKQPITRVEVDSIRGVHSGGVFNTLMEVNMIRIVGRSDGLGKPHLFGTTRDFLLHFGLKGLTDLPKPKELEDLLAAGGKDSAAADSTGDRQDGADGAGQAELLSSQDPAEQAHPGQVAEDGEAAGAVEPEATPEQAQEAEDERDEPADTG